VGEWSHFTSTLQGKAITFHDGQVYTATSGGVLLYDPATGTFASWGVKEGLEYPDLSSIVITGDWMWLGGSAPRGVLQIVHLPSGEVDMVDLGLDKISHIVTGGGRGFAAYTQGQDAGIIELRWDGQGYSYADIYSNFPFSLQEINDLDLWGDSLFVTTDSCVLGNNYRTSNLKDRMTWKRMTPRNASNILQYHADSTGHYFLVANYLYVRENNEWGVYSNFGLGIWRHMMRRQSGEFIVATSHSLLGIPSRGGRYETPRAHGPVLTYVDGGDEYSGYAVISNEGLAKYHHDTKTWIPLQPNSMAGNDYSTVYKLSTGEMMVAGHSGVARFNGSSWYNVIPGYYIMSGPEDEHLTGNEQITNSPLYLADTIYYRGKQSWNMVELPQGDLLVGFKGNPSLGGGILRLNLEDQLWYETYDTTQGMLDGLANDGFITIRHMVLDDAGNVWIANPYSEIRQNVIAVYTSEGSWAHFSIRDSQNRLNYLPTEITFDSEGRVWIGSNVHGDWGSPGGIAVLDYGDSFSNKSDDVWQSISLDADLSRTIWSLVFDHNDILWILSADGVMGYSVREDLTLLPYTQFGPFLGDIPFSEGSKIRVDAQNNKWITSPQRGVWVLLDNTTFWPDVEGFNSENSDLLSDEVLDIFLDNEDGVAYLATSKGISALKIPFKTDPGEFEELRIFPSPFHIPAEKSLVIDGLRQGTSVKIFTATGRLVRELTIQGGDVEGYQATWDGQDARGQWVGSGVYIAVGYLESGQAGLGKVAVIRQ
jgi:hypothetical protein